MDEQLARIAQKIKTWRTEESLSLQQLGDRCGVSPSTIHKIENGQSVPTIAVVLKLARGLGRRAGELVEDGPAPVEASVTRRAERNKVETSTGTAIEWLAQGLPQSDLNVWRLTLPASFDSTKDSVPMLHGDVVLLVEEGEVIATIGDREFKLGDGDSLHFKASTPYCWRNSAGVPARAILIGRSGPEVRERRRLSEPSALIQGAA